MRTDPNPLLMIDSVYKQFFCLFLSRSSHSICQYVHKELCIYPNGGSVAYLLKSSIGQSIAIKRADYSGEAAVSIL